MKGKDPQSKSNLQPDIVLLIVIINIEMKKIVNFI